MGGKEERETEMQRIRILERQRQIGKENLNQDVNLS